MTVSDGVSPSLKKGGGSRLGPPLNPPGSLLNVLGKIQYCWRALVVVFQLVLLSDHTVSTLESRVQPKFH